jgi:hypothetical protein
MEIIVARKILSQQKYATFILLQTQKSHAQHTIFYNASKAAKTITKRATSERISFHHLQNYCFWKKKENTTTTTTTTRRDNKAKPVLEKLCSPNFLPRAALESAMQSERESLERARA